MIRVSKATYRNTTYWELGQGRCRLVLQRNRLSGRVAVAVGQRWWVIRRGA